MMDDRILRWWIAGILALSAGCATSATHYYSDKNLQHLTVGADRPHVLAVFRSMTSQGKTFEGMEIRARDRDAEGNLIEVGEVTLVNSASEITPYTFLFKNGRLVRWGPREDAVRRPTKVAAQRPANVAAQRPPKLALPAEVRKETTTAEPREARAAPLSRAEPLYSRVLGGLEGFVEGIWDGVLSIPDALRAVPIVGRLLGPGEFAPIPSAAPTPPVEPTPLATAGPPVEVHKGIPALPTAEPAPAPSAAPTPADAPAVVHVTEAAPPEPVQQETTPTEPEYQHAEPVPEPTLRPEEPAPAASAAPTPTAEPAATQLAMVAPPAESGNGTVGPEPSHRPPAAPPQERAPRAEEPTPAGRLTSLAVFFYNKGHYARAETFFEWALAIRERDLGPHHPDVATSLENYAAFLRATNRATEAAKLEARASAIWARHAR